MSYLPISLGDLRARAFCPGEVALGGVVMRIEMSSNGFDVVCPGHFCVGHWFSFRGFYQTFGPPAAAAYPRFSRQQRLVIGQNMGASSLFCNPFIALLDISACLSKSIALGGAPQCVFVAPSSSFSVRPRLIRRA